MRLASYNVENLFSRAKVMNQATWVEGKEVLEQFAALSQLLGEANYTAARKQRMVNLMLELGLEKSDSGPFVMLRRNRGNLLKRPKTGGIEITAQGRADWTGLLELVKEPVDETAMRNTARAIIELDADVLSIVEAESRPSLSAFNDQIIDALGDDPYRHVMLIDGNDARGIDVGLMTRESYPIGQMRSHVDDRLANGELTFSRDCAQFCVGLPSGAKLYVLVNHFKSKGYGSKATSDAKRKAQALRVKQIYEGLLAEGASYVAVVGDLNDTPDSDPLASLLEDSSLKDAFTHPAFDDDGYPGTYGLCNAANKIDYLLLSPKLYARVQTGGVMRKAMWPGVRPVRWESFSELTRPEDAGSDHAAVWVDLDI